MINFEFKKSLGQNFINDEKVVGKWKKLAVVKNKEDFAQNLFDDEDILWSFQLACYAQSTYVINQKTYNYIIRENSIITQTGNEKKHLKAYLEIVVDEVCCHIFFRCDCYYSF